MEKSPIRTKTARITLRLTQETKDKWQIHCEKSNIYLSDFIINTVEEKMLENNRKEIMSFIENRRTFLLKSKITSIRLSPKRFGSWENAFDTRKILNDVMDLGMDIYTFSDRLISFHT